jgi:hypothetical protein
LVVALRRVIFRASSASYAVYLARMPGAAPFGRGFHWRSPSRWGKVSTEGEQVQFSPWRTEAMSSQSICRYLLLASLLTPILLLGGFVHAQEPKDPLLQEEAQRKALEAQKTEKYIKDQLAAAADLKDVPESAAVVLKVLREYVAADTSLSPERRKSLLTTVDARIKTASDRAANPLPLQENQPARVRQQEIRDQENERVQREMGTIAELRRNGKRDEADSMSADLARRFPNHPAMGALKTIGSRSDALSDAKDLRNRQTDALTKAHTDIVKSSIPAVDDVEFPRNWKELSARRSKSQLTDAEVKLLKALNTPLKDIDFDKMHFSDVLQYLQDKTGVNIQVPKTIMDEVSISYETPVTLKSNDITLRSVLKKVLGDLNLTYIVKNAEIQVTTPERAKQTYTTRAYYVGDLAGLGDQRLGPILQQAQMAQSVLIIMNSIVQTVEPNTWKVNNPEAGGTITFDPLTMSIIIKQTAEMQLILGGSLRR